MQQRPARTDPAARAVAQTPHRPALLQAEDAVLQSTPAGHEERRRSVVRQRAPRSGATSKIVTEPRFPVSASQRR